MWLDGARYRSALKNHAHWLEAEAATRGLIPGHYVRVGSHSDHLLVVSHIPPRLSVSNSSHQNIPFLQYELNQKRRDSEVASSAFRTEKWSVGFHSACDVFEYYATSKARLPPEMFQVFPFNPTYTPFDLCFQSKWNCCIIRFWIIDAI